jgi:hypothetical protein
LVGDIRDLALSFVSHAAKQIWSCVSLLLERDASGRRLSPRLSASRYSGLTELLHLFFYEM